MIEAPALRDFSYGLFPVPADEDVDVRAFSEPPFGVFGRVSPADHGADMPRDRPDLLAHEVPLQAPVD